MAPPTHSTCLHTLCDLLRWRAQQLGPATLYTYLVDGEQQEQSLSYAELDCRARAIGGWLRDHGAAGKPVLLVYPQGLDYIAAYFGCIYAGAIAVPAYPPRRNRRADRICSMVTDAGISLALTTNVLHQQMQTAIRGEPCLSSLTWQATDIVDADWADQWRVPDIDGDSIAFLQYTSGSTGTPKGVMVTHANLLHNQQLIQGAFRQTESIVVVGWLPLHHDMGLIGNVLHPLYLGGRFVFLSPTDFLQKPIRWLQAVSRYRGTIGGGPNFAYDLCVQGTTDAQRASLDLSSWQVAYNGAEPVRARTMAEFIRTFAEHGFRSESFCPCYGMAETTLLISGAHPGEPIVEGDFQAAALERGLVSRLEEGSDQGTRNAARLVACGIPDDSLDVRIVDPQTHTERPAGEVGEIWVAGPSVARGYWGNSEVTEQTFAARIRAAEGGPASDTRYLRTGDLGFIHQRQLYVTGRSKDLIIVRGTNHYPQDIERTVESSHEGLMPGAGAAFSCDLDGLERVIVVQEVRRAHMRSQDWDQVLTAIRGAVFDIHQLALHAIVLVRPGAVPKTTSGKIQRGEARRMYRQDEYKAVARWQQETETPQVSAVPMETATPLVEGDTGSDLTAAQRAELDAVQQWMLTKLSERLRVPPAELDIRQPFARYGMDSLAAIQLTGQLSDWLQRPVAATLVYDYPSIDALSHYLVTGRDQAPAMASEVLPADEPLAVVGIGCRFPGAPTVEAYWNLLHEGRDAVADVPQQRWGTALQQMVESIAHAGEQARRGGFLQEVDQFDARFFGISPREADELDPQQRLLLEVSWQAFEDAGIPIDRLAGSRTGVFVGISSSDYLRLQGAQGQEVSGYTATGNSLAVAANRISYTFDFRGPSLAIDTACSSSLVAVHQAVGSLRRGECDVAVAGGVNLILTPDATSSFVQAGMLSPTGACRAFSASADGFVRGEGCGLVVLKPLSHALRDGDRVYCLLRGTAVNQDGRSNGLTAPNGLSQQTVIRAALRDGGVASEAIDYIEAHGTGTELGDPIEWSSLAAVLTGGASRGAKLRVGSVKSNIGHLEAAAGIAGLIKTCLALWHEAIPASLHFDSPNPHIDWSQPLEVSTTCLPWKRGARPRLAGVNSFGFGGTNAHVVLQEAPLVAEAETGEDPREANPPARLLVLSAKNEASLQELTARYGQLDRSLSLQTVCQMAATGRVHFAHRLAVTASSTAELTERLARLAEAGKANGAVGGQAERDFRVHWLFTGQGGDPIEAGRELYQRHRGFRAELDRCGQILSRHWPRPLTEILWGDVRLWREVDVQPALFCLQYSVARLWMTWGLAPQAVLGHSLGEYAAACLAGVFSLDDALRLVTRRAALIGQLPERGGMLVVFAAEEQVRPHLSDRETVGVAAINGPRQTVLSGSQADLQAVTARLQTAKIRTRPLATTHGFHSQLLDPILDEFEAAASQVAYSEPRIPLLSTVTGDWCTSEVTHPDYWRRNLRQPVQFYQATTRLLESGATRCLEMGVGSALSSLIRSAHPDAQLTVLPGLAGKHGEWERLLNNLARLYVSGAEIDWRAVCGTRRGVVSLPTYAFQRNRHWFRSRSAQSPIRVAAQGDQPLHPLLGAPLDLATADRVFETDLGRSSYLVDHQVQGAIVFPAAAYLELAVAAAESCGGRRHEVRNLALERPLTWKEGDACRLQVVLTPQDDGFACRFLQRGQQKWERHATCQLVPAAEAVRGESPADVPLTGLEVEELYSRWDQVGLNYGPAFRGVRQLGHHAETAGGSVRLPSDVSVNGYLLHPALLDACIQVTGALLGETPHAWLPMHVESYQLFQTPAPEAELQVRVTLTGDETENTRRANLRISDPSGQPVAEIQALTLRAAGLPEDPNMVYQDRWFPQIRRADPPPTLPALSPERVERRLLDCREGIAQAAGLPPHVGLLEQLESLSVDWILAGLREMQVELHAGSSFQLESLAESLGIETGRRRLFQRLFAILCEEGLVQLDGDRCRVIREPQRSDPRAGTDRLLGQFPSGKPELTLLQRCATSLPGVLRGELDPLNLLFPRDGALSAADVYRHSPGGMVLNRLVAEAVELAQQKLTDGRGLRVLEIGAGTGATSEAILGRLSERRSRFVFTDLAPGFLAPAKQRFAAYPNVEYRVLDIERDPAEQGLQPGSFDLIVAANVLHATADLGVSLRHIHALLNKGGHLLVVEGTRPVRWLDLTFGLTPGWWRFQDTQLRPDYPLLSAEGWHQVLDRTGFEQSRVIHPLPVSERGREPENSILVARRAPAIETSANAATAPDRQTASAQAPVWLLLGEGQGLGSCLRAELRGAGHVCHATDGEAEQASEQASEQRGTQPEDVRPEQLADWLKNLHLPDGPRNVVFLWPLDGDTRQAAANKQAAAASTLPARIQQLCATLLKTVQALAGEGADGSDTRQHPTRLWIVTRGAQPVSELNESGLVQSPLWGMLRTLAFEQPDWQCRGIDLDPDVDNQRAARALMDELSVPEAGPDQAASEEVAFRQGLRLVRRLVPPTDEAMPKTGDTTRVLRIVTPGTLDGLQLVSAPTKPPAAGEVQVEVHASGLNFRDVLNALGLIHGCPPLGAECTGVVTNVGAQCAELQVGDRVAVIAPHSFCDTLTVPAHTVVRLPDALSLEQAATLPVTFLTALIALEERGDMRAGERVLIHSALGGVGQAAIQLARRAGLEIFATASVGKHPALRAMGIEHVYDSRQAGFAEQILAATSGQGVHLILNSLPDERLDENLRALGRGGRMLDIAHPSPEAKQHATRLRPDAVFHDIDLVEILEQAGDALRPRLQEIFRRCSAGELQPLPYRSFALSDAVQAFRYMRGGQHAGKILIEPTRSADATTVDAARPDPVAVPIADREDTARAEPLFRGDATYVITGGLGGLGLFTAKWMAERGARHLALVARRVPTADELRAIDEIRAGGCVVQCPLADVSDADQLADALSVARQASPPLAGVFHMAGVLDDALLVRQTEQKFAHVLGPKVLGAWNLHQATLDDALDYFVLFSSVASLFGSPGQANHAAANGFLDALCWHRHGQGRPALSINWGPWSGIGAAAQRGVEKRGDLAGVDMLTPAQGLNVLRRLLENRRAAPPQMAAVRLNLEKISARMKQQPLLEKLLASVSLSHQEHQRRSNFLRDYRAAAVAERPGLMLAHLQTLVAGTLGIDDPSSIPDQEALFDLGLDSLTSLELRNAMEASLQVKVSSTLVFDHPTLADLARYFALVLIGDAPDRAASPAPTSPPADQPLASPAPEPEQATSAEGSPVESRDQVADLIQSIHQLGSELNRWEESSL